MIAPSAIEPRHSGLPLVESLPRGSHFGVLYSSKQELLQVLVPFVRAGLELNEYCSWHVDEPLTVEEVRQALAQAVPDFAQREVQGQVELVPASGTPLPLPESFERQVEQSLRGDFAGLRFVRQAGEASTGRAGTEHDELGRLNAVAAVLYPRTGTTALDLMQVVQHHRFALVCNAGRWEMLEGSEAHITRQALLRTERALSQSEDRYRRLFESMTEEVHHWQVVRDREGRIKTWRLLDANPPTLKTWGRSSIEEIRGKTTDEIFGPGATEHYLPIVQRIMSEGVPHSYEDYFPNLDRYFRFTSIPVGDRFMTTGADISAIRKVARLYEVLSRVNESIVRTRDETSLFDQICRILAEIGGFPLAWIGVARGRTIAPVACAGSACAYLRDIKVEVDGELGRGPTGSALREDRVVINDDFQTNTATEAWRSLAAHHGFRASAALPLRCQGKPVGVFTLYANRPEAFDAQQVKLLDSLCADVSYALDGLEQERLRALAAQSLRRYELVVQQTRDIILYLDRADGRILEANPAAVAAYGYSREELLGLSIGDLRAPATLASLPQQVREAATRGVLFETEHRRKDGTTFSVEVSSRGAGEGTLVSVIRDITERRRAEAREREQRRAAEARAAEMDAVFNSLVQPVVVTDQRGLVVRANAAHQRVFDVPDDWLNLDIVERVKRMRLECADGSRLEPHEIPGVRALAGEAVSGVLQRLVHPDGSSSYLSVSAAPVRTSEGIVGMVGVFTDVTERVRTEQALQEIDKRKNEFLAVLSHELRNPLAPIMNSLYILDHAPPNGEQASRAKQVIARQVGQLSSLVNDLLDVTRISRNKIRLSKERLELNECTRRAAEDHHTLFDEGGVSLVLNTAARPLHVLADRTRVAQIVGNLLSNAVKFTARGGVTRVSVGAEGMDAVIRVADDGAGMAPETLHRLFQPFMQVEQTLDRSRGGLGLGLALVKGLVELHGGKVAVTSEGLGRGTEFCVRLPLDLGVALEAGRKPSRPEHKRRRVLLIEDNHDAADSLREVLEIDQHEVDVAHDGLEGIAKARRFKPDIVLCDIGLPGMDGFDVARAFRADEALRKTYLVALSGYALPEDLQHAAEAGFERHLAKPPSIDVLTEIMATVPER